MDKKKLKILFVLIIIMCSFLIYNSVYAKKQVEEERKKPFAVSIIDEEGNELGYLPLNTGTVGKYIDSSLNYDNCKYKVWLSAENENKYEETFTINGLGTFHFDHKEELSYYYIADIQDQSILKTGKFQYIDFKIKNLTTQKYEEYTAYLLCFKDAFDKKADLSINGIDIIKNGKVVKDNILSEDNESVVYDRVYNELIVTDYAINNIKYENMGKDFEITIFARNSEGKYEAKKICTYTGLEFEYEEDERKSFIVDTITEGNTYNEVVKTLGNNHNKLQVYDISLEHKGVKIQPDGKIKISIPIKNNVNNSKLVVYRISDDGIKTEYKVNVKIEDNINYATFETDHFSTYVLAEKEETKQPEQPKQDETIEEQPKQEDEKHILDNEPKTGITTDLKVVTVIMLIISIAGVIYCKKNIIKE